MWTVKTMTRLGGIWEYTRTTSDRYVPKLWGTVRTVGEFHMRGFGCILGGHLGSREICGWKDPPALLARWHFLLYLLSSGTTLVQYVLSSPGSLHLTAWAKLPRVEICRVSMNQQQIFCKFGHPAHDDEQQQLQQQQQQQYSNRAQQPDSSGQHSLGINTCQKYTTSYSRIYQVLQQ